MNKLMGATFLLVLLVMLQTKAFASNLDCDFKSGTLDGINKIEITKENLILNSHIAIPLDESRVRCANFGRQKRFDGSAEGYMVILKTCTSEAVMEGHLIDSKNQQAAEVTCKKAERNEEK